MTQPERQFRRLAFLQVLLGLIAFCLAEGRVTLLMVVAVLAVGAWLITEGDPPRGLPRPLLNLGALIAVILTALEVRRTHGAQPVALVGHFTMAMQLLILYGKKGPREYAQLAVLSPLQIISASVLPGGVTLAYGFMLVVYCLTTLMTAMASQVKRTDDKVHQRHTTAAGEMAVPQRQDIVSTRRFRLHRQAIALALGLGCGLTATLAFLALPRTEQSEIAAKLTKPEQHQVAGYSDEISLTGGSIGDGSPEPVLNITLTRDGQSVGSDQHHWLIRGSSLSHYDTRRRRWTRPPVLLRNDFTLRNAQHGVRLAYPSQSQEIHAQMTLRRLAEQTLFVPVPIDGPISLASIKTPAINTVLFGPIDQQLTTSVPNASVHAYTLDIQTKPGLRYREQYTLRQQVDLTNPPQHSETHRVPTSPLQSMLAWDIEADSVRAMAQQILATHDMPTDLRDASASTKLAAARALANYLRYNFRYTTDNPTPSETDPIIAFLFQDRAGHCELFASGLCVLCRSVGIPAGVATGFRASEFNEIGGYYTVRQSHAHAWTEIDLGPGVGWHTLDATPAAEVDRQHANAAGWSAKLRNLYDHLEFKWIGTIITYDRDAQHGLMGAIGSFFTQGPDQWAEDLGDWLDQHAYLLELDVVGYIVIGVIFLMLIISLISLAQLLLARHRRMVALQLTKLPRAQRRGLAKQLRFYIAMLETLERHGLVRPPWQSPFGYAKELAAENPMRFDPVVALTEIFYEIRFGHRQLDDNRRGRIKAHLRQLEHTLAEVTKSKG